MGVLTVPGRFPDIQSAVNAALPGDEIRVKDGIYKEQIVIDGKNNISIRGLGNSVILDGSEITEPTIDISTKGFYIMSSVNIIISGFIIRGFEKGIIVDGFSNSISIIGNAITDIMDDGIKINAGNSNFINNSITNCKDDAIKVSANNCSLIGNTISNNGDEGIEIHGEGNTIKQNIISNSQDTGLEINGEMNVVEDNLVRGSGKFDTLLNGIGSKIGDIMP